MSTDRDDEARLGALLNRVANEAPAPSTAHIEPEVLARMAEGAIRPNAMQRTHLAECLECRDILAAAAIAAPEPLPARRFGWRVALWPSLAMAAAAAFVLFVPSERPDGYRARGVDTRYEAASVTVLGIEASGPAVLETGAEVSLGAKLGFRYGNPAGEAKTLTLLGYDGKTVHWYYPEGPGKPAFKVEAGKGAVSQRLPFDIALDDHREGRLDVYAAFDMDPDELAAGLAAGRVPAGAVHVRLQVVKR